MTRSDQRGSVAKRIRNSWLSWHRRVLRAVASAGMALAVSTGAPALAIDVTGPFHVTEGEIHSDLNVRGEGSIQMDAGQVAFLKLFDATQLNATGGLIGYLDIEGFSTASLSRTSINGHARTLGVAHLTIDVGSSIRYVEANDVSTVDLRNSWIDEAQTEGNGTINVYSGQMTNELIAKDSSVVNISGGSFYGVMALQQSQVHLTGGQYTFLHARNGAVIHVYGTDLRIPEENLNTITGYWPHGEPFTIRLRDEFDESSFPPSYPHIQLHNLPEPAPNLTLDTSQTIGEGLDEIYNTITVADGEDGPATVNVAGGVYYQFAGAGASSLNFTGGTVHGAVNLSGQATLEVGPSASVTHIFAGTNSQTQLNTTFVRAIQLNGQASLLAHDSFIHQVNASGQSTAHLSGGDFNHIAVWESAAVTLEQGRVSDRVVVTGQGRLTINSGSFNDNVAVYEQGRVVIHGGSFNHETNVGGSGAVNALGGLFNNVFVEENGRFNFLGGEIDDVDVEGHGTLTMSGGWVDDNVQVSEFGTARISGGQIEDNLIVEGDARAYVTGGIIQDIDALGRSRVEISGGQITDRLMATGNSVVNIFGFSMNYDGSAGQRGGGQLTGMWADGTPFSIDYLNANDVTADHVQLNTIDFDADNDVDATDIDMVFTAITSGNTNTMYDLTHDGTLDHSDVTLLITNVLGTYFGDANLDRTVTIGDLVVMAEHFNGPGSWATGDFTGDGLVSIGDLVLLAENFGRGQILTDFSAVPSPGTAMGLLILLGCGAPRRKTKRK